MRYTNCDCPRRCSGHGSCDLYYSRCTCDEPYNVTADCSRLSCPYGITWSGKAFIWSNETSLTPHHYRECSYQGLCDRSTGLCKCFPGFEGSACQRASCECDHGVCVTLAELYFISNRSLSSESYTAWDGSATTACVCDYGYTGPKCDQRMCPKGADPSLSVKNYRTINITITADNGFLEGYFRFILNQNSILIPANGNDWTITKCNAAFEVLPMVDYVVCSQGSIDSFGGTTYTVQFVKFSINPYENNIFTLNDGDISESALQCLAYSVSGAEGVSCIVSDYSYTDIPEYVYCSNRGICDFDTGSCDCYNGFVDSACSSINSSISTIMSSSSNDIFTLESVDATYDFTGTILHLSTNTTDTNFNFIDVLNDLDQSVFQIDGSGDVAVNGSIVLKCKDDSGGLTIHRGGLVVNQGISILSGGLSVHSRGITVYDGEMNLNGSMSLSGGLSVRRGMVFIGDVSLYGSLKIDSGGVSIAQGGLIVDNGDLKVVGGFASFRRNVAAGAVRVNSGGLVVNNGALTVSGRVAVSQSSSLLSNVTSIVGGLTITEGAVVNSGLFVDEGALGATDVTVMSGGFYLSSGRCNITDTLKVTGGMTLAGGGLTIGAGNMKAKNGSMFVSGGLTSLGRSTVAGGFVIVASGVTVGSTGDSFIVGGIDISSGGTSMSELTVFSGTLMVRTKGMTVVSGMQLSNGMTITGIGVSSAFNGASTVSYGGIAVAALTVNSGSVIVSGSGSLSNSIGVSSGGMSILSGVLVISQGVSVSGHVAVSDGITVSAGYNALDSLAASSAKIGGSLSLGSGLTVSKNASVVGSVLVFGSTTISSSANISSPRPVNVDAGDVTVSGGLEVLSSLTIGGRLSITGGLSLPYGSLYITDGLTVRSGGVFVGSPSLMSSASLPLVTIAAVAVTGGSTMNSGFSSASGLTVASGGLKILSGGASIFADGLVVTGGLSISGGFTLISGGLTVVDGGAVVSGGSFLIPSGGAVIRDSGLTISSGFASTGGATISAGLVVSGRLSISFNANPAAQSGIAVTGGLTLSGGYGAVINSNAANLIVQSNKLIIGGGITASGGGLTVAGGLSVKALGSRTLAGLTVFDSGVVVSGGLTVASDVSVSGGLSVSSKGLSVDGLTVDSADAQSSAVTVLSNGAVISGASAVNPEGGYVRVSGGLSVSNGMFISNGLSISSGSNYIADGVFVFSDERLKDRIQAIDAPLVKVRKLRGVYFRWKSDDDDNASHSSMSVSDRRDENSRKSTGFIAQEVLDVLPEIVASSNLTNDSNILSIRYSEMLPVLLEALKILHGALAKLKQSIDSKKTNRRRRNAKRIIETSSRNHQCSDRRVDKLLNMYNDLLERLKFMKGDISAG